MARHAFAALIAVQCFYGLLPVAGKTVYQDLSPLGMTSLRVLGAAVLLVGFHVLRSGTWPAVKQWPGVATLATFGIAINMGLFALGLQWTHPVNATLIITIIPVATYVMAVATGKESFGPRRLGGVLLALLGVVYLIGLSRFEADGQTALGDVLVLINALSFSWFLVISKPWARRHGVQHLNAWMFVAATALFLPIALLVGAPAQLGGASQATWGWMAFIILGPTVGAYILNATALKSVPSSTVAVFIYLQTPVSALAAWLVLGTLPSWRIVPAALLILAGVTLTSWFRDKAQPPITG